MAAAKGARAAVLQPQGDAVGVVHVAARYSLVFPIPVVAGEPLHANGANLIPPHVVNCGQLGDVALARCDYTP